jgi:hypothetical protein
MKIARWIVVACASVVSVSAASAGPHGGFAVSPGGRGFGSSHVGHYGGMSQDLLGHGVSGPNAPGPRVGDSLGGHFSSARSQAPHGGSLDFHFGGHGATRPAVPPASLPFDLFPNPVAIELGRVGRQTCEPPLACLAQPRLLSSDWRHLSRLHRGTAVVRETIRIERRTVAVARRWKPSAARWAEPANAVARARHAPPSLRRISSEPFVSERR